MGRRRTGPSARGASGVISGTVTANRDYALSEASGNHIPALYAVRVRARDAERHITYTVFTQKGHYQIYNLPQGSYQMSALQDGFDSKGPTVELKPGDSKTADVALLVRPDKLLRGTGRLRYPLSSRPDSRLPHAELHGLPWLRAHPLATHGSGRPQSGCLGSRREPACLTWTAPAPSTIQACLR